MTIAHLVPVLRALSAHQTLTAAQLARYVPTDDIVVRLAILRDNFGMVAQEGAHWRLLHRLEWLDKTALVAALGDVAVADETLSTNDWARRHKGTFFFAEHQIQGRGRRGRTWAAMPAASILMSARLPRPPQLAGLSLAIGAALWRMLDNDGRLFLKWPNDLLDVSGKKVGGVLIETAEKNVIIGVGLNLLMTSQLQSCLNRSVTGLAALDKNKNLSRHHYATLTAITVRVAAQTFAHTGLSTFLDTAARAHCIKINEPFSLILKGKKKSGVFAGFANNGAMLMLMDGRLQSFVSGEIVHVAGG